MDASDAADAAAPSSAPAATGTPGAGRFLALAVAMFLLAILLSRALLQQDWGWLLAAAVAPVLLLALRLAVGWLASFLLVGLLAASVLFLRLVLADARLAWGGLAIAALALASAAVAWKVARALLHGARAKNEGEGEGKGRA